MPAAVRIRLLRFLQKSNLQPVATLNQSNTIDQEDPGLSTPDSAADQPPTFDRSCQFPLTEATKLLTREFEQMAIERSLIDESGNVSDTARRLGIHHQRLQQQMKQLSMQTPAVDRNCRAK